MKNEDDIKLKLLITESENRIHRHISDVQRRITSGMLFLFLCILFPAFAMFFVIAGILVMLFFPFFALLAMPLLKLRDHFTIKRVEKENQKFQEAAEPRG